LEPPRRQENRIFKFDTPDAFSASLKKERQMWAEVIRRNNIVAD